jgi:hypothetical protein
LQDAIESQKSLLKGDTVAASSIPIPKVHALDAIVAESYLRVQRQKNLLRRPIKLKNGNFSQVFYIYLFRQIGLDFYAG